MRIKLLLPLIIVCSLFLQGCYVIKQGVGQINIQLSQVPLEEAVEHEKNENYKKLLKSVPAIKQFAVEQLYLAGNNNYTSYYETAADGVSFVVTASPKTELKPYVWWFPVIGSVPYKGYFAKADALALEQELIDKGYDTYVFAAPAYSTLGWFKDPVTTPMLRKGYFTLASMIIHEMVHTTKYIKGQGDFNEQLASFIEFKGAIEYFSQNNLINQERLQQIESARQKRIEFLNLIRSYIDELKQLYTSSTDEESVLLQRERIFVQLSEEVVRIYPHRSPRDWHFNNARLLQFNRYDEDTGFLNEIWEKSNHNWKEFWRLIDEYVVVQGWDS